MKGDMASPNEKQTKRPCGLGNLEAEQRKCLRLIIRQTKGARTFMPTVSNGRRRLSGDDEGV
jgi:hypothetical protein